MVAFQTPLISLLTSVTTLHLLVCFAQTTNSQGWFNSSALGSSPSLQNYFTSVRSNANNQIPRLPAWNNAPHDDVGEDSGSGRHVDISQLFQMIGNPQLGGRDPNTNSRSLGLISRPKPRCNKRIRVLNGVTRIRERGSLARFQCSHGFTLIGPLTIVCLRDRWSEPPPICVRSGCRSLRTPRYGLVRQSIGGAVAAFYCLGGSKLVGDPVLYCDGSNWNGTEPTCYLEPTTSTTTTTEPSSEEDSQESWPASVATPNTLHSESTDENSDWDVNLHPLQQATSTFASQYEHVTETSFSALDNINAENHPTTQRLITTTHTKTEEPIKGVFLTTRHSETRGMSPDYNNYPTFRMGQNETDEKISTISSYSSVLHNNETAIMPTTTKVPLEETGGVASRKPAIQANGTSPAPTTISSVAFSAIDEANVLNPSTPSAVTFTSQTIVVSTPTQPKPPIAPDIKVTPPVTPVPVTNPRRIKIRTRRPPSLTRKPPKRPGRTTTTKRPSRRLKLTTTTTSTEPPSKTTIAATTIHLNIWDGGSLGGNAPSSGGEDHDDYPIAIDKMPQREHVAPIRPVLLPGMLNTEDSPQGSSSSSQLAHASIIAVISLFAILIGTVSAGALLYCWRKNKGIARASPYDMDGRTLSAHDANDDFMWLDQRDSGL